MLRASIDACVPELTDDPDEMLQQEWSGLCYTAAKRWVCPVKNADWVLVHGTVLSERVGKRYSAEETLLLSIKNRHDGPWREWSLTTEASDH